jgi:general secretion pathway protein K
LSARAARSGEDGFALVAALGAAMLLALIAYTVLASDRAAIADLEAQQTRARLEAAADAAVATAIEGLDAPAGRRWPIDGSSRTLDVDGQAVEVAVEDERGKIPLKSLTPDQARRLFKAAGASGGRLDQLTDSFLDWRDGARRPASRGSCP